MFALTALKAAIGFVLPELVNIGGSIVSRVSQGESPIRHEDQNVTLKGRRTYFLLIPWIVGHAAAAFSAWTLPPIWDQMFAAGMGITFSLKAL